MVPKWKSNWRSQATEQQVI